MPETHVFYRNYHETSSEFTMLLEANYLGYVYVIILQTLYKSVPSLWVTLHHTSGTLTADVVYSKQCSVSTV